MSAMRSEQRPGARSTPAASRVSPGASMCQACQRFLSRSDEPVSVCGLRYHQQCTVCSICRVRPDKIFRRNEKLFCEQHYDERFRSKCAQCQQVLLGKFVKFQNKCYHLEHFRCVVCRAVFEEGAPAWSSPVGEPLCQACFSRPRGAPSGPCASCGTPFASDDVAGAVSLSGRWFHKECCICECGASIPVDQLQSNDQGALVCTDCAAREVAAEIAAEDAEEKGAENADSNATADAAFLAALHGECNKIHLARGGNGDVFRVVYPASGKELALKVIKNVDDSAMALYEREFNNAKRLSHSNIVRIFDLERKGDSLFIRMELFGRDLASALSTGPLSERLACRFTRQLLRALKHCHSRKVVHRDLKGRNVLVDMVAKKVKLCDFGSSSIASAPQNDPSRFIQFTPNWAAPEILLSTGWTDRADIWSLGCVVIEMLTAKRPWAELGQVADMVLIYHIANKAVTPQLPTAIGAACQDFLHRCLQRDPQRRPSAAELLEHPWICGGRLASQRVQQPPTR